jgi:hypothetical protein
MSLSAADIIPYLRACGYTLLRQNFPLSSEVSIPLVAFANAPEDARSACIAVLEKGKATPLDIAAVRGVAAPIIFSCEDGGLQWWKQSHTSPERVAEIVPPENIPKFFAANKREFEPTRIYRAKTWGRYDGEYQLWFVDLGLMPLVEGEIGRRLVDLIVRNVDSLKSTLQWKALNEVRSEWLMKAVFWLISAKILRDKSVGTFANLDLLNVDLVFESVSRHFGTQGIGITSENQRGGLRELAEDIARFSSLELATTESLAYVYENALVSKATRKALGTHSTPAFLVDYIVGRLGKHIEAIDVEQRNVFEPACGHAAFLVSAMRYLTELLPDSQRADSPRRAYLRKRIHGIETDAFALEIARLSLSLTDIPNPNGWDLKPDDMFAGKSLEASASRATIFLANPPFENFSEEDREWYAKKGVELELSSKVNEVFRRTLPHLPTGAAIGLVAPQSILHSRDSHGLRRIILDQFDLKEICLFPDSVFQRADSEPVIILGVKKQKSSRRNSLTYARVREHDYESFQASYSTSFQKVIEQHVFVRRDSYSLRFAELDDVWTFCREMPAIDTIATLGKGLEFKSLLPRGAKTYQADRFPGAKPAFIQFDAKYIHGLPTTQWANLDEQVIRRRGVGAEVGVPQVLLNYAPVSRGPWRLKALIDFTGHAVTSRFIAFRPIDDVVPLEFLWALLNSPFANAFAYAHLAKRDVLVREMKQMPIPMKWNEHAGIVRLVRRYFDLFNKRSPSSTDTARRCLLRIDAAVLRLYDLPRKAERQLLDLFVGRERPGVPFFVNEYIPKSFEEDVSLRDFFDITDDWHDVNRRRDILIRKKVKKTLTPEEMPELSHLQQLAAFRQNLVAPLPLKELERLSKSVRGQK